MISNQVLKQGLIATVLLLTIGFFSVVRAEPNPFNVHLGDAPCCSDLELQDSHGVDRQLDDFIGKVVVVTFGYTYCPDVCPTILSELAQSVESLKAGGDDVQVIFVSIDPNRDTADVLSRYVTAFHDSFIALRGTEEETDRVARDFRVLYRKVRGRTDEDYTIDHTAGVYLFDRSGNATTYAKSTDPKTLVPELERLLAMRSNR